MYNRTYVYSVDLDFPVLLAQPFEQRVYMEWRGLPLKSPATLESIGSGRHLAVLKAWREHACSFIKLQHPDLDHVSVDYIVNWIVKTEDGKIVVLLELAPGWPGDGMAKLILTHFVGDKIVTLKNSDYDGALAAYHADIAKCHGVPECAPEELFGRMPDSRSLEYQVRQAAQMRLLRAEKGIKVCCIKCNKEVEEKDNFCASCGAKRAAPDCTKCGVPVTTAKDARVRYHSENGYYPWHFGWDGTCINCDFDYSARIVVTGGHNLFFSEHAKAIIDDAKENPDKFASSEDAFAGKTNIDIGMDQSVFMECDDWDYQPTIVFSLKRWQKANSDDAGALKSFETFTLTPKEWFAISEQLNGPLRVLLARQPWRRDTT